MKKMVKLTSGLVLAGFMLAFSLTEAHATASTHIWSPSTDVQPYKKGHVTSDFYVPTENDANDARPSTITNFGLTVGVLPFEKYNMELGIDHKSGTGVDDYPLYFNAKFGIPENAFGNWFPAFAIGIYDIGTEQNDRTDFNVFFTKLAKTFSVGDVSLGRFSTGYFKGNKNLLRNVSADSDGALIAWERTMTEISDKLWFCLDYQGSKSAYGAFSPGFSWKFSDNVSTIFGYNFYNNHNLADTFTVQVDIDF